MASHDHHILKQKKNFVSQNNSNRIRNNEIDKSKNTKQKNLLTQKDLLAQKHLTDKNNNSSSSNSNSKLNDGKDYSNKDDKETEDIQTIKPLRTATSSLTTAKDTTSTVNNSYKKDHTSLFTSKYNYNSSYSKLPLSLLKHKRKHTSFSNNSINDNNNINNMNNNNNNNNFILIQIDNLPPNKNWKQIKYLIGGIIHHSNVLQVKLLPPMASLISPFFMQQSCLVTLTNTLNDDMINDLILSLNSYTWDNYDLYSYVIPNLISPVNISPFPLNFSSFSTTATTATTSSASSSPFTSYSIAAQHELKQVKEKENEINYPSSPPYTYLPFLYPMIPPTMYLPQKQYRKEQKNDFLKKSFTSSQKNSLNSLLSPVITSNSPNNDISTINIPTFQKNDTTNIKTNEKQEQIPFPSFIPIIPTSSPSSSLQQSGVMLLPQTSLVPPIPTITNMMPPIPPISFPLPQFSSQPTSASISMKQPFQDKTFGSKVATSPLMQNQSLYNSKQVINTSKSTASTIDYSATTANTTTSSPSTTESSRSFAPNFKKIYSYPQHFINTYDTNNEMINSSTAAGGSDFGRGIPFYCPEQTNDMMGMTTDPKFIYPYMGHKRIANPFKQPKKLKSIFNERNFRKQMTERKMWQLKLDNFPPYLLPETETSINFEVLGQEKLKIDIVTNMIEKYGKLRWTILKDFIKLKCPKLLNLRGQHNESISDTTREFYVGVYEAEEVKMIVDIKPENKMEDESADKGRRIVQMEAILYNAIIGFHNKEYFDICLKNLQDQEYSLGYKLHVTELPPYNEEEEKEEMVREGSNSANNDNIKANIEEEEIRQEISDLNLS
ncbi:hypothetical protein RI543_001049 [Arxiozyma heterogenica]|uniref:Uncharacterized protein n=1 Tax=Arxiozyma heterogenica TaxID=278026 RepID=A0AAN7ZYP3_9SACH|nr:hypothetical protein RI543_001049 [Kazachstania heterogenica]